MKDLAKAQEALVGPATDIVELFERVSPYCGKIISVVDMSSTDLYLRSGVVEVFRSDLYSRGEDYLLAYLQSASSKDPTMRIDLDCTVKVLIDGQWKILHQPEEEE